MGGYTAPRDRVQLTPDAFAQFYDQAFGEVYRYLCRAVLGNRELAEDLTQETFASVIAALHAGHAELQSIPWVIGIARHKLVDHYRRCESEQRRMALVWAGGGGDEQDLDLDRENPSHIVELLRELSATHRLVLALRYVDELSVDEIAKSIDRSVHATESLLVRARRALATNQRKCES